LNFQISANPAATLVATSLQQTLGFNSVTGFFSSLFFCSTAKLVVGFCTVCVEASLFQGWALSDTIRYKTLSRSYLRSCM